MLNNYFFPAPPSSIPFNNNLTGDLPTAASPVDTLAKDTLTKNTLTKDTLTQNSRWLIFTASAFLVSVPVFIQAPLVRQFPLLSLAWTILWVGGGWWLYQRPQSRVWGDLLLGFSWSWLAGTIYWGWLRTEPYWHLPVESIGLPFGLWCLWFARKNHQRGFLAIGTWFYFGSLWGTALTDGYFYVNNLIPYWRAVMAENPALAAPILHQAIEQINNPLGWISALMLICLLLVTGLQPLKQNNNQNNNMEYWAFSGAILSTILVDGLFWLVAAIA